MVDTSRAKLLRDKQAEYDAQKARDDASIDAMMKRQQREEAGGVQNPRRPPYFGGFGYAKGGKVAPNNRFGLATPGKYNKG